MKKLSILTMLFLFIAGNMFADDEPKVYLPWQNGKLKVSDNGRYLQHENGTPFFWMGETGWLLPEKLNRDEANASTGTKFGNRLISEVSNYKKRSLAGMFDQMTEFNFK